jgi:tetratricopeptide (TPR) repeat protein
MRKLYLLSTLIAAALAGCSSSSTHPAQTPKAEVVKQWNDARSGVLISLARDQYENGAFDKSRQTLDEALKLSPDSEPAHVLSAKLFIEMGQLEAAERELALARQLDATDAQADYLSGVVYQRWQQPERALEFYQHACDKSPAELAYVMAKAETLVAMGRRADALAMLQERVAYFEHSGVIRDEVGLLLIQEKRYHEAVEMLRRASILATDDQTIREHLAMALFYDKQYQESADILSNFLQQEDYAQRADILATLGECQLQLDRPGDAARNLQMAAALLPGSAGVWLSLAKADVQIGNLRSADIALNHSVAQDSSDSQTWLLLGYLRLRQSRNPAALDAFCRASQMDPQDTVSLCMVGLTLDKLGRNAEALACFQKALHMDPKDEMAAQLMARLDLHE